MTEQTNQTRTITLVKNVDGKILINYSTNPGALDKKNEISMKCQEEAHPSFYSALEVLDCEVVNICGFPEDYTQRITVKGVNYFWKDGIMSAMISAQLDLEAGGKITFNTPKKPEKFTKDDPDASDQLSDNCIKKLKELINEAEAYIVGRRKVMQEDLFNQKDNAEEESIEEAEMEPAGAEA